MRSLRGRLLLGGVMWTIGLLSVWAIAITLSNGFWGRLLFVHTHSHLTAAAAIAGAIAGFVLIRRAFVPFDALRSRLSDVRKGLEHQLHGEYPSEIQPLVDDLNALLAHSQQVIRRAIGKAGDLAHGLKTPLAVLSNEAERLSRTGHDELAATIAQQVALMQRQVDYHLAHARAAASGASPGARAPILESADGLSRTLHRLHADRGVAIHVNVQREHAFRGQREDLDEMLGNLLDNACKWARSQIVVSSSARDGTLLITVDDDGPGLDPSMREIVLQRGVRADQAAPGSGLGLAIVRDLAELYGGSVALTSAATGGLRAELTLPSC